MAGDCSSLAGSWWVAPSRARTGTGGGVQDGPTVQGVRRGIHGMSRRRLGAYLPWVVAAGVVLALLFLVVGGESVLEALATADRPLVVATFAFGLCWLLAWSLMLRAVLGTLGVDVTVARSFLVYAGAVFANNVTPFGQAGGEPVAALLISKRSDAPYETGLVGIASVDVLNVVPSISLVLVGVGYYATTVAVGDRLLTAVGSAVALVAAVGAAMVLAWRYRWRLVDRVSGTVGASVARFGSGRFDPDGVEADVADRASNLFGHVEQVATDRRRLALVVGLSLAGWLFQAAALLAALAAVGHAAPVSVVLFVIPLANLAGATPLPGGLGGIEAAFVALLVPTTGIPAAEVTAAVLVYRGAIYWMPVLLGGGSVVASGVRTLA